MTPEELNPEQITLPNRLRITQRLGQVPTSREVQVNLFPSIVRHAEETMTHSDFVQMLADEMDEYNRQRSQDNELEPFTRKLLLYRMPSYIRVLLDSDGDKLKALEYWNKLVDEFKEPESFLRNELPRRQKKADKKAKSRTSDSGRTHGRPHGPFSKKRRH